MSNSAVLWEPTALKEYFDKNAPSVAACFPLFAQPVAEKMMRTFLQSIPRAKGLSECTLNSVVGAFLQAAYLGLEVSGPSKEACIVPVYDKHTRRKYAQMWPMVQGLAKLAWRNPKVGIISCQPVHENDHFELSLTPPDLQHRPPIRTSRGAVIGAYAYYESVTGQRSSIEWCDMEELNRIRGCSANPTGPAWAWPGQMYRKAPMKRMCKAMPKFVEQEGFAAGRSLLDRAVELDNENMIGSSSLELAFESAELEMPEGEKDLPNLDAAGAASPGVVAPLVMNFPARESGTINLKKEAADASRSAEAHEFMEGVEFPDHRGGPQ